LKKNKTMRAAGGLLVATLLSTSIVSGTFAKYVTSDSASDTARVAKFGVKVESGGGLFADTYKSVSGGNTPGTSSDSVTDSDGNIALTVKSSNGDNVVAPGTKSEDSGLTFKVTGTPEVAVKVAITVDSDASDVWLGTGTYPNMTTSDVYNATYEDNDVFTIGSSSSAVATANDDELASGESTTKDESYYPIKYTLTQTQASSTEGGNPTVTTTTGSLKDIIAAIEKLNKTYADTVYAPNTDLSQVIGTFTLTWEWDFDDNSSGTYDKEDTLLGDLAADSSMVTEAITSVNSAIATENKTIDEANKDKEEAEKTASITSLTASYTKTTGTESKADSYSLNTEFGLTISVTQVD
jgi:hypothetical protein